jgi:type I restriction enzyme S subunit
MLKHPAVAKRLKQISTGVSVHGVSKGNLSREKILLPSLHEQEAIAGVLECWDKAIRNYEKKIEKERNIKKGLMQRLLSGKQRLPGFSGEWKKIVFGEVFDLLKTYAFSREQLTLKPQESAEIYNIHYGDIHAIYTGYALDLEKERAVPLIKKATEIPSNPVLLQEGDLIIADVSEDYEGVGACVELRNIGSRKVTVGLHAFVARDKRGHSALGYRSFLLKHPAFAKRLKQISTGVSVHGISKGNLLKEKISLPPLHEQQAIASLLSAADSEIEAMERKLVILKDQKKFLLNNLVTGTIRLPKFRGRTKNTDTNGDHT